MSKILKNVAKYSTDRISLDELTIENYISTENILQNKNGKVNADRLPPNGNLVTKYDKGDILIANIRPYLKKIWYASNSGGSSSDVLTLKVKSDYNSKFIYYSLFRDNFFDFVMAGCKGTKMPRGDKNQVLTFSIPTFNFEEQTQIAKVLSDLDAKIELNNKINAELEAMAKLIYDYWFVQFEFPNEEGKPYKSSGGKMVWNEELKRDVPEGWEVEKLSTCCEIIDCLHSKKSDFVFEDEKYYLLQLENISDNGLIDLTSKYYVSNEEYNRWTSRIEVKDNDLVITNAGRVAALSQIPQNVVAGIGRNITAIRPKRILPTFLYYSFNGAEMKRQIKLNTDTGSFFQSLNVRGIKELLIVRPNKEFEEKFESIAIKNRRKRELDNLENQKLAELRDWLLPMLMNGQVKVSEL